MARFDLIPAIDLQGGRLARLTGGDPASLQRFGGDPMAVARSFVDQGAAWIHVVDLDAALTGRPANLDVLESVAELPVRVEAGGGLSAAGVDEALRHGASRAILGARALFDPADPSVAIPPEEAVARYGERVGVAVDVRGGRVAPRGSGRTGPPVAAALRAVAAARPALVVYTDVDRDGRMAGPDLDALRSVVEAVGAPVLASGGVRSLDDLKALLALAPGVVGAIVGRALQEGSFSLEDGLALLSREAGEVID